jgi:ribosomal protein S8E
VLDVVYNASNNELVRTKTLVKNSIVQVDATPYRAWYEQHYGVKVGLKKAKKAGTEEEVIVQPFIISVDFSCSFCGRLSRDLRASPPNLRRDKRPALWTPLLMMPSALVVS